MAGGPGNKHLAFSMNGQNRIKNGSNSPPQGWLMATLASRWGIQVYTYSLWAWYTRLVGLIYWSCGPGTYITGFVCRLHEWMSRKKKDWCNPPSQGGWMQQQQNLLKLCKKFVLHNRGLGGGDCMNRLVCRRRIGVIHLHWDDRCSQLWDIYSLEQQGSQGRGLPKPFHRLFQIGKFSALPRANMMWKQSEHRNVSSPRRMSMSPQRQCRPPCGFARDNLSGLDETRGLPAFTFTTRKEASVKARKKISASIQAIYHYWHSYFHFNIKSCSNTVPFAILLFLFHAEVFLRRESWCWWKI